MRKQTFLILSMLGWMTVGTGCAQPTPDELLVTAQRAVVAGEHRTAEIHLRNLLREEPDHVAGRALLGQVRLSQGDPVSAEVALRRALALGAEPSTIQIPLLEALVAQGRFSETLAQIESGPQVMAEDRVTVLRIGATAHRGLNQFEQAEQLYRSALELDPESVSTRTDLANLFLTQNRLSDARRLIIDVLSDDPAYSPALVLRGTLELLGRRFEDAKATFLGVIEREGPQGQSHFGAMVPLVEVSLRQGDIAEASGRADELIAAYPDHPVAIVLKAEVEVAQGNLDSAGRRLDALIARMPTVAPANRVLGIVNARRGQYRQAQMYLQSAINQGQDRRAVLHLAKIHLEQGDRAAARQVLQRMLAPQQELSDTLLFALAARTGLQIMEDALAAEFLELGLEASSGEVQELLALASVYSQSGELDRAQALLEQQSEGDDETAWIATVGLALTQLQERDFSAADQTAERLLSMQPTSPLPANLRGMIAVTSQDFSTAMEHFSAALRADAQYVPALINRAQVYMLQRRTEDAIRDFRTALDVDAGNEAAILGLAELDMATRNFDGARQHLDSAPESIRKSRLRGALAIAEGQFREAAEIFNQLFEQAPTAEHAVQAYTTALRASLDEPEAVLRAWLAEHPRDAAVNFTLGSHLLGIGNHREATERFETVVEENPQHAAALNNLAWLYGEAGDGRAVQFAERAYTAAPENPAIADTLGWLRVQNGDARNGLPLLEQSHRALPENAEIHYHFAAALAATGQNERAAEELRRLLAANPGPAINAEAERLLQEVE